MSKASSVDIENQVVVLGSKGFVGSRLLRDWPQFKGFDLRDDYFNIIKAPHSVVFLAEPDADKSSFTKFVEFVRKHHPKNVVLASTAHVYGVGGPFIEGARCRPLSTFAKKMLRVEAHATTVLRLGEVCGEAPVKRRSFLDELINAARSQRRIEVCGEDVWKPVLGLWDCCRAIIEAVTKPMPGLYNLCSFNVPIVVCAKKIAALYDAELVVRNDKSPGVQVDGTKFTWMHPEFKYQDTLETILTELLDRDAMICQVKNGRGRHWPLVRSAGRTKGGSHV
jgi:hypothetical protein